MDQHELRTLESRCIQEEAPECTAACPIHVDARAFVRQAAAGAWTEAWKVLRTVMPFPGILGRICDAPCRGRCKRGQVGDPIEIGRLERACVTTPAPAFRLLPLPRRGQSVAVIGSGLSGLTVAWDLARKGYSVHILEPGPRMGGPLRALPAHLLPETVLDQELEPLTALGVTAEVSIDTGRPGLIDSCLKDHQAVFICLETISSELPGLGRDAAGSVPVEPLLQSTTIPRVYAGGTGPGKSSPVWQAAQGRWAATSIDRFLQGVSLTAGREKDGPYKTRLFTSLQGIGPLPRTEPADPAAGYSPDEARAEAGRCLQCQCLECVKVCTYLEHFGAYPRKYAREIYNNESIVMGPRQANRLINSCSLCGLCERVCPEDFAMQDLCLQARRAMVAKGKMPPSAHEFALEDMRFSLGERFHLVRHAPGRTESAHAFYPGCQLCASAPGQVQRVYAHLAETLPGGVGLMLGCCGAPAHWAGRTEEYTAVSRSILRDWDALGRPRLIVACSTCFRMLSEHLPQVPTVSLWQSLESAGLPSHAAAAGMRLAVHDPCTSRPFPDIQTAVRRIAQRLGVAAEELALGQEHTECCGYGGLMQNANPVIAREVAARRAQRSPSDYLAYCAVCRDSLASTGKRTLHLLDLLFPEPGTADPALRPRPGWSERRENRARLRSRLLATLWTEKANSMRQHEDIRLILTPEVEALLEKRRILLEDVRRVIGGAEFSGRALAHPQTGRLKACHRPFRTTIWVEYTPAPEGYQVHAVYSHRMNVLGEAGP